MQCRALNAQSRSPITKHCIENTKPNQFLNLYRVRTIMELVYVDLSEGLSIPQSHQKKRKSDSVSGTAMPATARPIQHKLHSPHWSQTQARRKPVHSEDDAQN